MYSNHTDMLATAQAYSELGFAVFPCHTLEGDACSCGKTDCSSIAKHPLTEHGVKDATRDADELKRFFGGDNARANIALATGEPSGVWVLDADDLAALAKRESENGTLPQTPIVETGSGGRHYYFAWDERCHALKNSVKFSGALDVRATGGYVLLPPSLHASGNRYRWLVSPTDTPVTPAPDWLIALAPKHTDTPAKTLTVKRAHTLTERAALYLQSVPPAVSGQRGHDATFSVTCRLVELFGELTDAELLDALESWNERCDPPWSESELRHKLASAREHVGVGAHDDADEWPTLHADALYGFAGELVRAIEPHTEADTVGVLVSLLTCFGNAVGKRPYFSVGAGAHHANLFACLVGDTASGKGQAWDVAQWLMRRIGPDWTRESMAYGLSSGEGLVERVADGEASGDAFTLPPLRSLLCLETEFAKPITAMRREGNTLSALLRSAWDGGTLEILTRGKSKLRASNAYVSVLAHVTPDELRSLLSKGIETANGFANRFLWCLVRSTKSLPHGGDVSVLTPFIAPLVDALERAKTIGEVKRSPEADALWESVYPSLKASRSGAWGKATERARPQVMRLALTYALLDSNPTIHERHLQAALALWRYCDDSACVLFGGDNEGSALEQRLRDLVRQRPGIMRSELRHAVSHNTKSEKFEAALAWLVARGDVVCVPVWENRQAERYYPGVGVNVGRWDIGDAATPAKTPEATSHSVPCSASHEGEPPTSHCVPMSNADATPTPEATSPASQCPTSTQHDEPRAVDADEFFADVSGNVAPASLAALLDWRNAHGANFVRREDGGIWVTTEDDLTPSLKASIAANQAMLTAFVPTEVRPLA